VHCIPCRSLVLETEEGGAEASLQYVEVLNTEGAQANLADEGILYSIIYGWLCIYVQELNETLDA
jgi:hypothetical protein